MIKRAAELLSKAGVDNPVFEVEVFLAHLLNTQRHNLYVNPPFISKNIERKFFKFVLKRCSHIPVAYILRNVYFYGYNFKIRPGVFIPRPETETIIDVVCQLFEDKPEPLKILDICTGSGVLAIVLAKIFANSNVIATDISKKAVSTAKENVSLHGLEGRVCICRADILPNFNGRYDLIVSNPPYLTDDEMKSVPEEVKKEPACALYGGPEGIDIIKRIIIASANVLNKGGFIVMEIAPRHIRYFKQLNICSLNLFKIHKDICGYERVVVLRKI